MKDGGGSALNQISLVTVAFHPQKKPLNQSLDLKTILSRCRGNLKGENERLEMLDNQRFKSRKPVIGKTDLGARAFIKQMISSN